MSSDKTLLIVGCGMVIYAHQNRLLMKELLGDA